VRLEQSHLERRRFLCKMLAGGTVALGAAATVPLVRYAGDFRRAPPPDFLVLEKADYDLPPGKSRMFLYGPIPMLLLRTLPPESELRIFVATCTHLNCTVGYREDQNCIFCACHEGYYDTAGQVTSGPPPLPLRRFFSKMKDDKLIVALEKENLDKAT
jgi:cytochrome b6-f complex iron-sulfur subunit